MITITKTEFWTLIIISLMLSTALAINTFNSNKLSESYNSRIETYQNKIDGYEKEIYELRTTERNNRFVIDASLINTEKLNIEIEKNNLLTVD